MRYSSSLTARVVVNVHLGRDECAAPLHVRYGDVVQVVQDEFVPRGGRRPVGGGGGCGRAGEGRCDGGLETIVSELVRISLYITYTT